MVRDHDKARASDSQDGDGSREVEQGAGATEMLRSMEGGDPGARDAFYRRMEPELRRIAGRLMRRQRPEHTLQTTALANEACVRMLSGSGQGWRDRAHFLATAARAMRHVLVDHARAARAEKRGAGARRIAIEALDLEVPSRIPETIDLLALHEALTEFAGFDAEGASVVEMTLFGGYSVAEIAEALGRSTRSVEHDLAAARAWLYRRLGRA